jgi:hypothetical protein
MMTEMDIETSVYYVHLTRLIAREDFIKYTYMCTYVPVLLSADEHVVMIYPTCNVVSIRA